MQTSKTYKNSNRKRTIWPPEEKEIKKEYNFTIENLVNKAKKLEPNFRTDSHVLEAFAIICEYVNKDSNFEKRVLKTKKGSVPFSFKKGLFFISNTGAGKSFWFEELLKQFFPFFPQMIYRNTDIYHLSDLYAAHGFKAIFEYNNTATFGRLDNSVYNMYVDDFGRENQKVKHYGNEINFIDHFLDNRSRLQKRFGVVTHGSSNFNLAQFSKLYSAPTFSRMRALFNFIILDAKTDYRTI